MYSNSFLVADSSESRELRLWLVYSIAREQVSHNIILLLNTIHK